MTFEDSSQFRFIVTADGSPTLEVTCNNGISERMHSSNGAFSESLYIYGQALHFALLRRWPIKILSVGLGMGYNELIACAISLRHKTSIELMDSFELEPFLREQFLSWLGFTRNPSLPIFHQAYDGILNLCAMEFSVPETDIKNEIVNLYRKKIWRLLERFDPKKLSSHRYSVLFFDPFSKKANPEFWGEQDICDTLIKAADQNCVFSTYAATGDLKRALQTCEFQVDLRPGFKGKRNSTLAWKSQ